MKPHLVLLASIVPLCACYRPTFPDGTMACAEAGKACPDGFRCEYGLCVQAQTVKPLDGAAEETTQCSSPVAGCIVVMLGTCDPVCQAGCPACSRCVAAANGATSCVADRGDKTEGQTCSVNATSGDDDCAAGLTCVGNACYTRCARLCRTDDDCDGARCNVPAGGGLTACDVPNSGCDPLGAAASAGCSSPLTCYVIGPDQSGCDCPGLDPVAGGQACTLQRQCIPGFTCITAGGATTCRPVCSLATGFCPSGTGTCQAYGQPATVKWGYCAP